MSAWESPEHWGLQKHGSLASFSGASVEEWVRGRRDQRLVSTNEQAGFGFTLFFFLLQEVQGVPVTPALEVASTSSPQPGEWFVKS